MFLNNNDANLANYLVMCILSKQNLWFKLTKKKQK